MSKIACRGTTIGPAYEAEPNRMEMGLTTLAELRNNLSGPSPEYTAKQLHKVPIAPVVDRTKFLLDRCRGKVVLDIGASGPMHYRIAEVASKCYGIDRENRSDVLAVDLDDYHSMLPEYEDVEVVICGEVIEHLSNPGWFLDRLRKAYTCPVIITVPNAFGDGGRGSLAQQNLENCNLDHVAWYSHRTIKTLLERAGYSIREFYWYGHKQARPKFSEGLIVVTA